MVLIPVVLSNSEFAVVRLGSGVKGEARFTALAFVVQLM